MNVFNFTSKKAPQNKKSSSSRDIKNVTKSISSSGNVGIGGAPPPIVVVDGQNAQYPNRTTLNQSIWQYGSPQDHIPQNQQFDGPNRKSQSANFPVTEIKNQTNIGNSVTFPGQAQQQQIVSPNQQVSGIPAHRPLQNFPENQSAPVNPVNQNLPVFPGKGNPNSVQFNQNTSNQSNNFPLNDSSSPGNILSSRPNFDQDQWNSAQLDLINPPKHFNTGNSFPTNFNGNGMNMPAVPSNAPNLSHLSSFELAQLRQSMINQISGRISYFQRLIRLWSLSYYFLGILSVLGNGVVVGLSSSNIQFLIDQYSTSSRSTADDQQSRQQQVEEIQQWIIVISSIISTIALGLNAQLQCHMNATYFKEAVSRYRTLQSQIWNNNLQSDLEKLSKLNAMYDEAGVGPLVSFNGLLSFIGGRSQNGQESQSKDGSGKKNAESSLELNNLGMFSSLTHKPVAGTTRGTKWSKPKQNSKDALDSVFNEPFPKKYAFPLPRHIAKN